MKKIKPTTFIIFGGTGDLAQNKILPAFLDLKNRNLLPDSYKIVSFSRREMSDQDYKDFVKEVISKKGHHHAESLINEFLKNIYYVQGQIEESESYNNLNKYLQKLDDQDGVCTNKMFYLAVPPKLYEPVFRHLDEADLVTPCNEENDEVWTRVLVEKPFGSNPEEAKKLDILLGKLFDEDQIFRIDHYLAKETLQNIITFRFANPIFEPVWNNKYIEKIEVNLFESSGVESRGAFYDSVGALRDVGQNHILQMLALITMEDPGGLKAEHIRESRQNILYDIVPASKKVSEFAFRAQYEGFKEEDGVEESSETETFFRLKLNIRNRRWKDVPIYVSSGKALSEKRAEIKVTFKEKDSCVCPADDICHYGNTVTINIQPEKTISICFWNKVPGFTFELEEKKLSFKYGEGEEVLHDAYEKVLYDCIAGDQSLFTSTEEVSAQWHIISKICDAWKNLPLETYPKGTDPDKLSKLI